MTGTRVAHAVTGLSLLAYLVLPLVVGRLAMYVVVAPMLGVVAVAAAIPQRTWSALFPPLSDLKWHTVAVLMALLIGLPMVVISSLDLLG